MAGEGAKDVVALSSSDEEDDVPLSHLLPPVLPTRAGAPPVKKDPGGRGAAAAPPKRPSGAASSPVKKDPGAAAPKRPSESTLAAVGAALSDLEARVDARMAQELQERLDREAERERAKRRREEAAAAAAEKANAAKRAKREAAAAAAAKKKPPKPKPPAATTLNKRTVTALRAAMNEVFKHDAEVQAAGFHSIRVGKITYSAQSARAKVHIAFDGSKVGVTVPRDPNDVVPPLESGSDEEDDDMSSDNEDDDGSDEDYVG